MTPNVTINPEDIARLANVPAVRTAFDRWQEARRRYEVEPWAVTRATVDEMKARWVEALRAAQ